jgi:hypothetical protein
MKNDKSDKAAATSATSATQGEGLTSLLGGSIDPNDPLAFVGLGVGATQRAKDLVLKGLEVERQEALKAFLENEDTKLAAEEAALAAKMADLEADFATKMADFATKMADLDKFYGSRTGGKGRPTKGWLTIDVERAAAVIDAADFYFQGSDKKISSQEKAIEIAVQIDAILVKSGDRERSLFLHTDIRGIRNSVSKGLKEFPDEKDRFIKK